MKSNELVQRLKQMMASESIFPAMGQSNIFPKRIKPNDFYGDPADFKAYSMECLDNFDSLRNVFDRIERTIKNIGYKNKYIALKDIGYRVAGNGSSSAVNANETNIANFTKEICEKASQRTEKYRCFVTGKVGVGKTTFLRYVTGLERGLFLRKNISFVYFGYDDYGFDRSNDKVVIVRNRISSNIIFKTAIVLLADYCTELLLPKLLMYFSRLRAESTIDLETYENFIAMFSLVRETYIKKQKINIKDFEHACAGLSVIAANKIIKYFYDENCNVVVIFDGLDRLSPDDWYTKRYEEYMHAVQDIVFHSRDLVECRGVLFHYILVLRNCTYKLLVANKLEHYQYTKQHKVDATPIASVVESAINCVLHTSVSYDKYALHVNDNLQKLFLKLLQLASNVFELNALDDLVVLFEHNHRKTFRFLYDIALFSACYNNERIEYKDKSETQKFAKFLARFNSLLDFRSCHCIPATA